MDNIQKLREKVEKDPKSTVFVRLADELKKAGELDEAIEVLRTGIEKQPGYMSARVALGKIYMDKEMSDEAKTEFMQVVEAAPDNIFARKKLAELYRDEGDIELAIEHYKKYLVLSPQDEEAQDICRKLEREPIPEPKTAEETPAKEEPVDSSRRPNPLTGAMAQPVEAPKRATAETPAADAEDKDINAEDVYLESSPYEEEETEGFLSSLSEKETEPEEESSEDFSLSLQEKSDKASGHGVEFKGFDLEGSGTSEMVGQDDIDSMIEEVAGVPEEPEAADTTFDEVPSDAGAESEPSVVAAVVEQAGAADEPVGVVELPEEDADMGFELQGVPLDEDDESAIGIVEIPDEDSGVELEGFVEPETEEVVELAVEAAASAPRPLEEAAPVSGIEERFAEADAMVEREEYGRALEVYRRLLAGGQDDPEVRQRAEELRGLIKLLGKDREIAEARLMAFLESLKRKKHEFFGSS